jgi:hypothetical protein
MDKATFPERSAMLSEGFNNVILPTAYCARRIIPLSFPRLRGEQDCRRGRAVVVQMRAETVHTLPKHFHPYFGKSRVLMEFGPIISNHRKRNATEDGEKGQITLPVISHQGLTVCAAINHTVFHTNAQNGAITSVR